MILSYSASIDVGAIVGQAFAIGEEFPGDITWMVIGNYNTPLIFRHPARLTVDLTSGVYLVTRLVAPKHVSAGVTRVRKYTDHP